MVLDWNWFQRPLIFLRKMSKCFEHNSLHVTHFVHPPPPPLPLFCWGWIDPPTKFSKMGEGWTGSQFLEGVAFFRGSGGEVAVFT